MGAGPWRGVLNGLKCAQAQTQNHGVRLGGTKWAKICERANNKLWVPGWGAPNVLIFARSRKV